jgi:catechol 2,3-dioxygenase-like lactoylglutathione lyase family enzyme
MTAEAIALDHLLVPARHRHASAKLIADLLGVPWGQSAIGPFTAVYVNDGLTLDFDEMSDPIPTQHYCFRVSQAAFDAILARIQAAGIAFRSTPHGPVDHKVSADWGGRIVYWNEPDDHVWEMLTESYARRRAS